MNLSLERVDGPAVGHEARLRVSDNGIGLRANQLTFIFDLFAQVDAFLDRFLSQPEKMINTGTNPTDLPTRRILIVDDNRDAADTLAMLLKLKKNEVHTRYGGQEAIEAGENIEPDVVLLDIGMPGLNGYETARLIRQQPWGKNIMLIALTGYGQEEDKRLSQQAGFDAHLVKPVDLARLTELLA